MFDTAIAGSLPKPAWLAETETLWPAWKLDGAELERAQLDATLAVLLTELAPSKAASLAARLPGAKRHEAYSRALELAKAASAE